jgi:hypothetical protein
MAAMVMSFLYRALLRILGLVVARGRADSANEVELLVLRYEIAIPVCTFLASTMSTSL